MLSKKIVKIFFILLLLVVTIIYLYSNFFKKKNVKKVEITSNELSYKSNIIENVKYESSDANGNKYTINALKGEIDYTNPNIIYLTDVNCLIVLSSSEIVTITSNYGKYNSLNLDTIFNDNVIVNYLDNKITGEYLDFSLDRNTMIISQNVIYLNLENILRADVIEMNIETKDTKIFMYDKNKKVNIKNRN